MALIIRGDESFSPDGHTTLLKGDEVLVVTPANVRDKVERRLTDLGRGGRLAMWHRGGRRWTRAQRRAHAQGRRLQAQADKQAGTAQ